jgi:hypothetical protein
MKDNLEKFKSDKRLLNILACGKTQFTVDDIKKLSQLPGINYSLNTDPDLNPEQQYYDKLNLCDNATLIMREKELSLSIYNKKIEKNMIRNLLINRGLDLQKDLESIEVEYNRFMKNIKEENERYGLIK